MPISIKLEDLASRLTRTSISGNNGVRRIALNAVSKKQENDGGGITAIYNGINRFGNSLMAGTINVLGGALSFSFTKLVQWTVSATTFIMNFNWNSSDKELEGQIKRAEVSIAASKGGLVGKTLGYAVCGILPTATIAVFNEPMALYIIQDLGEEMAEEIAESLAQLIKLQVQQWTRMAFINLFKNYRSMLRGAAIGFAQTLVNAGILSQDSVDKANKKRNEPWSFAGALDETIDSIEDPVQQAYVEEFYDEFFDACIDAGFIVAGGIDGYLAQQKLAKEEESGGKDHTIEILFDRTEDTQPTAP